MKPTRSILDPSFVYTPAASTDLHKTFARIRRELRKQRTAEEEARAEAAAKVRPILERKAKA